MALIEIQAKLNMIEAHLDRIATALETIAEIQVDPRAAARIRRGTEPAEVVPSGPEKLGIITNESLWEAEREAEQLRDPRPMAP